MKEEKNENLLMFGQAKEIAKKPRNKLVKKLAKKLGYLSIKVDLSIDKPARLYI